MSAPLGSRLAPYSMKPPRAVGLDALRGWAILLMILDHVWLLTVSHDLDPVRLLTRLAMPVFFLVAGHLVTRLSWRHAGIAALGIALPVVVPWIDSPNVLVLYALGAAVVVLHRRLSAPLWVPIAFALTLSANGISWGHSTGAYGAFELVGLMCLGAMLPRATFAAVRAPRWVQLVGRRPLRWYVGHLLALQLVVVLLEEVA